MTTLTERYEKWDMDRTALYEEFPGATREHPDLYRSDYDAVVLLDALAGAVGLVPGGRIRMLLQDWYKRRTAAADELQRLRDATSAKMGELSRALSTYENVNREGSCLLRDLCERLGIGEESADGQAQRPDHPRP